MKLYHLCTITPRQSTMPLMLSYIYLDLLRWVDNGDDIVKGEYEFKF